MMDFFDIYSIKRRPISESIYSSSLTKGDSDNVIYLPPFPSSSSDYERSEQNGRIEETREKGRYNGKTFLKYNQSGNRLVCSSCNIESVFIHHLSDGQTLCPSCSAEATCKICPLCDRKMGCDSCGAKSGKMFSLECGKLTLCARDECLFPFMYCLKYRSSCSCKRDQYISIVKPILVPGLLTELNSMITFENGGELNCVLNGKLNGKLVHPEFPLYRREILPDYTITDPRVCFPCQLYKNRICLQNETEDGKELVCQCFLE